MSLPSEQYAFLAAKIYDPLSMGDEISNDTHRYKVRYVSPPSATNYRGAVLQEQETHQLVVINKGTEPGSIHDVTADLGMGLMGAPTQWPEAATTMREALRLANEGTPANGISITGHSLGGALAQLQAAMPESAGAHVETFNAYGAQSMARIMSKHQALDVLSAQERIINHRMYHDPVSALAAPIGRTVEYMDYDDYQRHKQSGMSPVAEAAAIATAHGIGNFWDAERNQPGAVFAHNYMRDLHHRPLDDLPPGVPLDLSAPWQTLGHQEQAPMPPLAATASTDEMFDYLCKAAVDQDDKGFMEALRQIGQTDFARDFHAHASQQVDMEDRITALETQLQQDREQQMAQAQQVRGPVLSL